MSKRHDVVSKILTTSFAFAALFGASSIFYAFAESRLGNSLDNDSALSALKVSLAIDKISLKQEMKKASLNATGRRSKAVNPILKALFKRRTVSKIISYWP